MKIENLKAGMTVKNYKELCVLLNEKVKTGNSKMSQLKDWKRYFEYDKDGAKFVIISIYDLSKPKDNNHGGSRYYKEDNLLINYNKDLYDRINYFDEKVNLTAFSNVIVEVKCKKCNNEYSEKAYKVVKSKGVCSRCTLSKGAKLIYDYLNINDIPFKMEFTFDDLKSEKDRFLRFDFAVLNQGVVQFLIEYDGEYHDEDLNNSGTFDIISKHDEMKDKYCKDNSISLIRIHHSASDIEEYLANKINEIGLGEYIKSSNKLKERRILEKIRYHQEMIDKLNKELNELDIIN